MSRSPLCRMTSDRMQIAVRSIIVGPTWLDLYGSDVELDDGSVVVAEDDFLKESILEPNTKIVIGYPANAMPQYDLSDEEIADIIEFIKSISN